LATVGADSICSCGDSLVADATTNDGHNVCNSQCTFTGQSGRPVFCGGTNLVSVFASV
jgi:hypothetical protein